MLLKQIVIDLEVADDTPEDKLDRLCDLIDDKLDIDFEQIIENKIDAGRNGITVIERGI